MLLTLNNLAYYLIDKGLLDAGTIVSGEWTVHNRSARNNNFATNAAYDHHRYLVKQVRGFEQEKTDSLRIEASCYWLANNDEQYAALREFLPKYYDFDPVNSILVTELLADVENLQEHFFRTRAWEDIQIAVRLAELLASYHSRLGNQLRESRSYALFQKQKPWVFSLVQQNPPTEQQAPPERNAEHQLLDLILRHTELKQLTQEVESLWQATSLLHGDIKFNNFLIRSLPNQKSVPDIRLIDWELADIGDPLWDVAGIFSAYLAEWVMEQTYPPQATQPGWTPLGLFQIQPAMSAFWAVYTQKMGCSKEIATRELLKASRFLGVKLIYSCFESSQKAEYLSTYTAKLLQVALNVLKSPERAVSELLGI